MDEHVALCKEILQLFKLFTEKTTDEATQYAIPLLVQLFIIVNNSHNSQQLLTVILTMATTLITTNQNKLLADRIAPLVVDVGFPPTPPFRR